MKPALRNDLSGSLTDNLM